MPYCCRCGNVAAAADQYCARCGAPQRSTYDLALGISPRTASILCYIPWFGWIAAIVVLASATFRYHRAVRFHAFQGLYLFVLLLIIDWVLAPMMLFAPLMHLPIAGTLKLAMLGLSIFMMIKASHEEYFVLPVVGELAEKSLSQ